MSSLFQMRQIKLRSLEDAKYTTQYNRVRFDIQADDMSTDLSQSYLLIRLILADSVSGVEYSTESIQQWLSQNVMVSFGYEEQSYSPASMIKTARLVNKKTGSVVEEIQFANVLNQYLYQMINDKETMSSQNLLTGSAMEIGKGSGITQAYSAFLQNPTSIRILLKDIFGCCNTSNFYLSETGGLELNFELEDRLPILRTSVIAQPERFDYAGSAAPLLAQYPSALPFLKDSMYDQFPDTMGANTNTVYDTVFKETGVIAETINAPKAGFKYLASFFEPLATAEWVAANNAPINTLTFATPSDAGDPSGLIAKGLGFIVGATVKLNFTWSGLTPGQITDVNGGVGVEPKVLEWISPISAVSSAAQGQATVITFQWKFTYPKQWAQDLTYASAPQLTSVEVLPSTFAYVTNKLYQPAAAAPLTMLQGLAQNTLLLTTADLVALEKLGIIAVSLNNGANPPVATAYVTTHTSVEFAIQAAANNDVGSLIHPDILSQQNTTLSRLSSNVLVRLPVQGRGAYVKSISGPVTYNGTAFWTVTFSELGVNLENGWDLSSFAPVTAGGPPAVPTLPPATVIPAGVASNEYQVMFFNAMAAGILPAAAAGLAARVNPYSLGYTPAPIPLTLTYQIDRFEIVLIQQTKNPKMPMSMGCSTWRVEPQNIQYPLYQWSQQFSVTEPNCYNAVLLTPDYLPPARQLVSTRRNIARYRNSLNNIDFANRDTVLASNESDYPSSLYSDQLIDYFANSQYPQRSLYGLREVAHSREIITAIPMKVYNAFANGNMLGNGGAAYTLQVNLYGDPSVASGAADAQTNPGTLKVGPVFLFKQCIKSWNE